MLAVENKSTPSEPDGSVIDQCYDQYTIGNARDAGSDLGSPASSPGVASQPADVVVAKEEEEQEEEGVLLHNARLQSRLMKLKGSSRRLKLSTNDSTPVSTAIHAQSLYADHYTPITTSSTTFDDEDYDDDSTAAATPSTGGGVYYTGLPMRLFKDSSSRLRGLEQENQDFRYQLQHKSAELDRVKRQLHMLNHSTLQDGDVLALQYQSEAQQELVMQLTHRTEVLAQQLAKADTATERKAYQALARAKEASDARAVKAVQEKNKLAQQVETMRTELIKLQREAEQEAGAKEKLTKLRTLLDDSKKQKMELEMQLREATKKESQLKERMTRREALLCKAQARCRAAETEANKLRLLKTSQDTEYGLLTVDNNSSKESSNMLLVKRLDEVMTQHAEALATAAAASQERDAIVLQVAALQEQLQDSQQQLDRLIGIPARNASSITTLSPRSSIAMSSSSSDDDGVGETGTSSRHQESTAATVSVEIYQQEIDHQRDVIKSLEQEIQSLQEKCCQLEQANTDAQSLQQQDEIKIEELTALGTKANSTIQRLMHELESVSLELNASRQQQSQALARVSSLETECQRWEHQARHAQQAADEQGRSAAATLRAELEASQSDFDKMRHDLHMLSKTLEDVKTKLHVAVKERDAAQEEKRALSIKAAFHEQSARAKELDLQEQISEYERLAEEHRRVQATVSEIHCRAAARDCELQLGAERSQAALQRRVATAEASSALYQSQLSSAQSQMEAMRQQLVEQQQQVEELENLLAALRAEHCRREAEFIMHSDNGIHDESVQGCSSSINASSLLLQQEVDRLLDLLAESEAQKSRLKQEREQLKLHIEHLENNAPGNQGIIPSDAPPEALERLQDIAAGLRNLGGDGSACGAPRRVV